MQVRVLLFGVLKDLLGRSSETLVLPDSAIAGDVISHYRANCSSAAGMLASSAISVNREYAAVDTPLHTDDEVALLPPVSGGSSSETRVESRVEIVHHKVESAKIVDSLKLPDDGAAVVFEGIVRNHTRGRRTLFLDYEAYEEMALKQLHLLAEQAKREFQIRDLAIVHRLGRLEVGETSVLIVVTSAHRAAAFDACRWVIDTLKRTVPIWKKEHFEDGAVWADGEPFPEPLTAGTNSRSPASK
jgi:MoaE-MoaD fusion protein